MIASHVQAFFIEEITEKQCPKKDLNMPKKIYSRFFYQSVILLPSDQLWKNNPKRVPICLSGELSTLQSSGASYPIFSTFLLLRKFFNSFSE